MTGTTATTFNTPSSRTYITQGFYSFVSRGARDNPIDYIMDPPGELWSMDDRPGSCYRK
jgi:hypothetical protein